MDEDETLASVIDRAAEQLGSRPFITTLPPSHSFGWVAFDDPTATTPLYQRKIAAFTLLDQHGEAIFGINDFSLIPYGQILRSGDAGLVSGDPRRLYIIRQVPQGDVFGMSWEHFVAIYLAIRTALDVVSTADEIRERSQSASRIVRRGLDALRKHAPRWGQRNGRPADIRRLVESRPWSAEELSRVLACPEDELADVLVLLGFTRSSDGAWRRRARGEEPVLDDLEDELREGDYELLDHSIDQKRLLNDRVVEIVRHGRQSTASVEDYRVSVEQLFPDLHPGAPNWRVRVVWFVERVLRVR